VNSTGRLEPEREPTAALWVHYRATGDPRARTRLLDGYLGLVHHAAREQTRRGTRGIEVDELVSAGTVGLVQALEGYDPERGQAFSSYAMPRIRGAIQDELRSQDWRSRGGRSRTRALERAQSRLEQHLGRRPSPEDVAGALGIDLATYWRWDAERHRGPSGTGRAEPSWGGDDTEVAEHVVAPAAELPEESLAREQALRALRAAFLALPDKDRLVLAFSFEEGLSLREIAQVLHLSESRVSQIRTRGLARLRDGLNREEDPR
jgi:RNA polymerase sigma factor for flagellar operon FliA